MARRRTESEGEQILLVSASHQAKDCAGRIEKAAKQRVKVVGTLLQAISELNSTECSVVVLDESCCELTHSAADALIPKLGLAVPVFMNLAICDAERVLTEVRAALRRREQQKLAAMNAAEVMLRNEFTAAVTGILLSSELAMKVPSLPEAAAEKLRSVHDLAIEMRSRLRH
jgi:hypothetical protein